MILLNWNNSAIKKISELVNRIIKNGVDHGYDSPEIKISYGGKHMKWIF